MCDMVCKQGESRPAVSRRSDWSPTTLAPGRPASASASLAHSQCASCPGPSLASSLPLALGENHLQEGVGKPLSNVATFRQMNKHTSAYTTTPWNSPPKVRIAPQGETVLLTTLREGQRATVM